MSDCAICTEELKDVNLVTTICGHKFHFTCLNHWQNTNARRANCPLCRAQLDPSFEKKEPPGRQGDVVAPRRENNVVQPPLVMSQITERTELDVLSSFDSLFLPEELSVRSRDFIVDMLKKTEISQYKRTTNGLVLYFRNGRRLQFRVGEIHKIIPFLAYDSDDSKGGKNYRHLMSLLHNGVTFN